MASKRTRQFNPHNCLQTCAHRPGFLPTPGCEPDRPLCGKKIRTADVCSGSGAPVGALDELTFGATETSAPRNVSSTLGTGHRVRASLAIV